MISSIASKSRCLLASSKSALALSSVQQAGQQAPASTSVYNIYNTASSSRCYATAAADTQQQASPAASGSKVVLPEQFKVDEFLAEEERQRQAKKESVGTDHVHHPTPSVLHTKSRYIPNVQKFDRKLRPVWDYNKMKAFNKARYPAIEAETVIPPKRIPDELDAYRVRSKDSVAGKLEFKNGVNSSEMLQAGVVPDAEKDLVARIFSWQNASQHEKHKKDVQTAIAQFQTKSGDTGSTPVQIAVLTQRINYMTEHMKKHHKDFATQRKLQKAIHRRKKLMQYLKDRDGEMYWKVIKSLDLRITF